MFLDKKNNPVPYNLDPSSFRNTSLSFGNTIDTGDNEDMKATIDKKNKTPIRVLKFTDASPEFSSK